MTDRLVSPTGKDVHVRPVHANRGLMMAYRKKLKKLIADMQASVEKHLTRRYKAAMAQDAPPDDESPANALQHAVTELKDEWQQEFEERAGKLARWFADKNLSTVDGSFQKALKDAGFSVSFTMTDDMQDAMDAVIHEQVNLIKSIPSDYLDEVEGMVMRSVQHGRDLNHIHTQLRKRFDITKRRAETISRDQSNKATAVITRTRQKSLGITEAIWQHSSAGKHPRPSHVAANGKKYDVEKGMKIDGEFIFPGEKINCFPGDMPVNASGVQRLWRAPFDGPMIHVCVGSDLLKGTPNHPVLTARGWLPLGLVEDGDKVVCMVSERGEMVDHDKDEGVTTFSELFESCSGTFANRRRDHRLFNFYGDRPNGQVDEIVIENTNLASNRQSGVFKNVGNIGFAKTNSRIGIIGFLKVFHSYGSRFLNQSLAFFGGLVSGAYKIGFATVSQSVMSKQNISYAGGVVPRESKFLGNGGSSESLLVKPNDEIGETFPTEPTIGLNADSPELFAQFVRIAADRGSRRFNVGTVTYEFRSVSHKRIRNYSGHVYTMQVSSGYYSVSGASVQAKNCRCVAKSVIPGFNA